MGSDRKIKDFITGKEIKATPEEVEAVQVFLKILVEDYGYPKELIKSHPQWRVKVRPSDTKKEYPVDIAVFSDKKHTDDNVEIIVECKKKDRTDGLDQLQDYLRFSKARIGVWFNGEEKLFLKKTERKGEVVFEEIPNIPKYGQRLEDVGLYKRKDLRPTHNLKAIFRTIRNYLAANAEGITRDEVFAQQIINLIFCKIYDERFTRPEDEVSFRAGLDEQHSAVKKRIEGIFEKVRSKYNDVISEEDKILLDATSLTYAVGELQLFCIVDSERDAVADAFETFIGPSLKGGQGQFFTPRNVVSLLTEIIDLKKDEKVIDPACGSGGFLIESIRRVWAEIDKLAEDYGWPDAEVQSEKQEAAIKNFRGLDKDNFLSKVAKAYMAIIGDGRGGVFCENSLQSPFKWKAITQEHITLNSFDVVITNPPFGKKLKIDSGEILQTYDLGHKWKFEKADGSYHLTGTIQKAQSPQILFIERCMDLLKDGGRLGIIAPESMFCNPSHRYIIEYIESVGKIKAVISLPEALFQPYTHAKTCAVVIEKGHYADTDSAKPIFMAMANWCGHDSRGLPIPKDDLPKILDKYVEYSEKGRLEYDHWGFMIDQSNIKDKIYLPKYYNPEIEASLTTLSKTHTLIRLGDLVESGYLLVSTGDEVGKLAYGTGGIPFVRTSDIANWEIKLDPKQGLSEEIYTSYQNKQDVQENDILMVRDGTYLVGTCAMIGKGETKIVYQSHLFKIRSLDEDVIHPYVLLSVLSSPIVKAQIFSKRFTQDIIDTLGARLHELVLPIPKSKKEVEKIKRYVGQVMDNKAQTRELTKKAILEIAPVGSEDAEFMTLVG